jgi:hypothetical protein
MLLACGAGDTATTTPVTTVPVAVAPTIMTQPAGQTVTAGQTATFSVGATGSPAPSYQWRKGGVSIAGATSATYTTPTTTSADDGSAFSVVVSNTAASVTSAIATLTVKSPPTLASFAPTHAAFGFQVVLTGTNFTAASAVTINGVVATVIATTPTTLTVAIPSNGTSGPIVVSTAAGTVTSSAQFIVDAYGPPIVIKTGGTYSGNWQSLDPAVAAVQVLTPDPVVVENCKISSASDGVQAYNVHANLTVRHCSAAALNPNVAGKPEGFFVVASKFASLIVEHNSTDGFVRIGYGVNYPPDLAETFKGQIVTFRYNIVHNIETRFSDGHGGFSSGASQLGTASAGGAFTVYFVRDAIVEYAWNEIINQPFVSQTGDVLGMPESRGLAGNPINIHDNYVQGANPADAAIFQDHNGCAIQIGDAPLKDDVGFVHVHDNQTVNFSSCGVSISSGHDIEVDHNRVISARLLPDGTLMNNQGRTPLQINDYYWDPHFTNQAVADPNWHDNSMHDNAFSAVRRDGSLAAPIFFQMGATVTQANNVDALGHLATTADEQAEYVRWKQKLSAAGLVPGP